MRFIPISYNRHSMVVPCTEITMLLSVSREILPPITDHSQTELYGRLDSSVSIWPDHCFLHSVSYRKNSHSESTKKEKIGERPQCKNGFTLERSNGFRLVKREWVYA